MYLKLVHFVATVFGKSAYMNGDRLLQNAPRITRPTGADLIDQEMEH